MNLRKAVLYLGFVCFALNAFGHAGEVHKYMGTVTTLHADGSLVLKTTDGKTVDVAVSSATQYLHADGQPAARTELAAGKRIVATISKDGKTATTIKLAATRAN